MAKKILWMSRHSIHESQVRALRELFGKDVVLDVERRPFDDARQIAARYRMGSYEAMVIVAPLSVLDVLCKEVEDIKMLWSDCVEENDPNKIEFRGARGQGFRFVRFRHIKRVALEFHD